MMKVFSGKSCTHICNETVNPSRYPTGW